MSTIVIVGAIAGAAILCALILATTLTRRWTDPELGAWRRRRDEMRNVRRQMDDMNRRPD